MKFLILIYGANPTSDNSKIVFICTLFIQPANIQLLNSLHFFLINSSFVPDPQITKLTGAPIFCNIFAAEKIVSNSKLQEAGNQPQR